MESKIEQDKRSENKRILIWSTTVLFIGLLGAAFYFISEYDKLQEESLRKEAGFLKQKDKEIVQLLAVSKQMLS